ncbi:patatin-like phospholipase family protein [Amycolatopsis jiangsuensis]|uniref:NTE family protein n=1 Tax=Amycolatopsis jiangsuensis TaxID=1181879 RepID=A0A840J0B8_9PSEU|nr:patatin-like phospholipase family protein [Amycolatopsis jiangsuensis]MBB4687520.1 NTE family protein [Amycolatopsis jiangsuensis]
MSEALVLGGGGVAGIAWTVGLLTGLAEAGNDVTGADLVVGTSAGATVAAQLGSGLGLAGLYARQAEPGLQTEELQAELDLEKFGALLERNVGGPELRRAVGRFALESPTVPQERRRAVIAARLPSHEWPSRALKIVAVEAETGEATVFGNASGVPLVDAVAASGAVPGVWPPVTIGAHRYVDGGVRSGENADYAIGFDRVLVIAPMGETEQPFAERPLPEVTDQLRASGAKVAIIGPDAASLEAIGPNVLDPATRTPAAEAGRTQGRSWSITWK